MLRRDCVATRRAHAAPTELAPRHRSEYIGPLCVSQRSPSDSESTAVWPNRSILQLQNKYSSQSRFHFKIKIVSDLCDKWVVAVTPEWRRVSHGKMRNDPRS